jgi:flagellar FliL protein
MAEKEEEKEEKKPESEVSKKGGSKILMLVSFILLILISGGIYYVVQNRDSLLRFFNSADKEEEVNKGQRLNLMNIGYITLPDLIVNLRSTKNRTSVLKASFVFELEDIKDKENIEKLKPIIIDEFQTYLRELEIGELNGSGALERVRQELFTRVNTVIEPLKIRKILIKEFLTQ